MSDELKLKPCPFCGSEAVIETMTTALEKVPRYRIKCKNTFSVEDWTKPRSCFCMTDWDYFSVEEVVEMWNRRANDD